MRSRFLRTAVLAAAASIAAALTLAAPAAARPVAGPLLPTPWRVTNGAASAGGTVTFKQDPLGVMGTWTVKGSITAPGDGDCYYVQITVGRVWNSTPACGSGPSPSFVATFSAPVLTSSGTARLCAARPEPDVCGTPATLW
jgi:hypothetical protein